VFDPAKCSQTGFAHGQQLHGMPEINLSEENFFTGLGITKLSFTCLSEPICLLIAPEGKWVPYYPKPKSNTNA